MSPARTSTSRLAPALLAVTAACDPPRPFVPVDVPEVPPDIAPSQAGAPCGVNESGEAVASCTHGQLCLTAREGFPNGYCAPDCLRAACPAGARCVPVDGARRYCFRACEADGDCRAREGYACRAPRPGALPVCVPNSEPLGTRDGRACYASGDGDAGGPGPFLAPLPRVAFASASSVAVSAGRADTLADAEASIDVHPTGAGAVVAFMGYDARADWRSAVARVGADGVVAGVARLRDRDFPDVLQPVARFDRAGRVHAGFLGNNIDRPGNVLRYAVSADGGATFTDGAAVFPENTCNAGCSEPALAVGPDASGANDAVYAAAIAGDTSGGAALLVARAPAATARFDAPVRVAEVETTVRDRRAPAVAALAAGPEPGALHVAYVAANTFNGLAYLGDRANRVRVRVSRDGGRTFAPAVDASREGDAPVSQPPWVGVGGGAVHVAYVAGGLSGAWDVVLATSRDGARTFAHRRVNDDPDRCATHAFAGLAVDPRDGAAHLAWLDNRYGGGIVAYARCPADPAERCGRNELVSGGGFVFTTSVDSSRWHGTRSGVALGPDGAPWVTWSDTRTGGPRVYLARGGP